MYSAPAAVALFPMLLEALETVFGKLMDDLRAGFGGRSMM